MTARLLEALCEYWLWKKPRVYLFPSKAGNLGVEQPISNTTVRNICRAAATRAGIEKKIGPILCGIALPRTYRRLHGLAHHPVADEA